MPIPIIEAVGLRWNRIYRQCLDLFFPPRCDGCHRTGVWLCDDCLSQVPRLTPPFCERCGDKVESGKLCARCRTSPLHIESIRSVVYFEGVLRHAMHQLKYRGRTVLAESLGGLMADYWTQHPIPIDVVVPVPLHATRLRERGYNQAGLLAREMARQAGLTLDERTLVRHRSTVSQVDLNAEQRRENVHAAFTCSGPALAGMRVLVIDDVCTTGSTLDACAVALKEGGATSVHALTLARAR